MEEEEIEEGKEPVGGKGSRERKMTQKGEEHQTALLEKESKRTRKTLTRTMGLFEDLLRTKDVEAVKSELKNLQGSFVSFEEVTSR